MIRRLNLEVGAGQRPLQVKNEVTLAQRSLHAATLQLQAWVFDSVNTGPFCLLGPLSFLPCPLSTFLFLFRVERLLALGCGWYLGSGQRLFVSAFLARCNAPLASVPITNRGD